MRTSWLQPRSPTGSAASHPVVKHGLSVKLYMLDTRLTKLVSQWLLVSLRAGRLGGDHLEMKMRRERWAAGASAMQTAIMACALHTSGGK